MAVELPKGMGYIGLGNMGIGMAGNLLSYLQSPNGGGAPFHVYNRTASKAAPLVLRGAMAAESPAQLAASCRIIFSCLENDDALRDVFRALLASPALPRGLVFVDSSTVLPATTQQLAHDAAQAGIQYVAAPVFGRPPAAAAKQVFFVLAGSPEAKEEVVPYLQALGRRVVDVGDEPHLANVTKLSGNFYVTSLVEMIAEGFALAEKNGVPRKKMSDVLNALCPTPVITGYSTRIAEGSGFEMKAEEPGFSVLGGMKDVGHILELGRSSGVPLPMSEIVMTRLKEYNASGKGRETNFEGFSSVVFKSAGLD